MTGQGRAHFRRHRFTYLFVAILAYLILQPVSQHGRGFLIPFLLFLLIVAVLKTLDLPRRVYRTALGLGFLALLSHLLWAWFGDPNGRHPAVDVAINTAYFLFLAWSILLLGSRIFKDDQVTADTIRGGIAVYFLAGLAWAMLYGILLTINPEALSITGRTPVGSEITYYSFVTLTTLGYGDVVPQSTWARNLAFLEAALGTLYVTVLIARLVGLHIRDRKS